MNDETVCEYPFINEEDFNETKTGKSCRKELLDSGYILYIQQKKFINSFSMKVYGNGDEIYLYSVKTLEDINLLFEDISEVLMLIKKVFGYSELKKVFEYFRDDKKYAIKHKTFKETSDDEKITVYVHSTKGTFIPRVIDYEKNTHNLKDSNSIAPACATFDEAKEECINVLDEYNINGCYHRKSKGKFVLEHECESTVEKSKIRTVELTQEQFEVLETIFSNRGK